MTKIFPSSAAVEISCRIEGIRARVPAGGRLYLAAPRYAHACFLADRAPLPPFGLTYLAATGTERRAIVDALDRRPPDLAVVTDAGLEQPFAVEHPEERAWLAARYRLDARIGEVQLWVPLAPPGNRATRPGRPGSAPPASPGTGPHRRPG